MTKVIRKYGAYELIHDALQGLFRVTDGIELSFYFCAETKSELIGAPDSTFVRKCRELIKESEIN